MTTYRVLYRSLLALAAGFTIAVLGTESRADVELGTLTCSRIAGTGFNIIIYSKADVRCTFAGSAGSEQWYQGSTGVALGVDLKWNVEQSIYFAVVSSTRGFAPEGDFLSGKYAGVKAEAAVGVGVGAAVLVGGNDDTLSLQPAIETSKGAGVAAGLGYLNMDPDPLNKARLITPHGTLFATALYAGYFDHAFNYRHRPDYAGSDYFSEKAIAAGDATPSAPDEITKWKLPPEAEAEAETVRVRLMAALEDTGGRDVDAATAQVSYDCWLYGLGHEDGDAAATCRRSLNSHLEKVESAVAEQDLMRPNWYLVLFATDVSDLDEHAVLAVDDVMKRLGQLSDARVYVMGNADRVGPKEYNQALSEKRATSVKATLIAAGVPESWVSSEAFGEKNPISISRNPHDALNRRVDVAVEPIVVKPEVVKEEAEKKKKQ